MLVPAVERMEVSFTLTPYWLFFSCPPPLHQQESEGVLAIGTMEGPYYSRGLTRYWTTEGPN